MGQPACGTEKDSLGSHLHGRRSDRNAQGSPNPDHIGINHRCSKDGKPGKPQDSKGRHPGFQGVEKQFLRNKLHPFIFGKKIRAHKRGAVNSGFPKYSNVEHSYYKPGKKQSQKQIPVPEVRDVLLVKMLMFYGFSPSFM